MKHRLRCLALLVALALPGTGTVGRAAMPPPPGGAATGPLLPVVKSGPHDEDIARQTHELILALKTRLERDGVNLDHREAARLLREALFALRGPLPQGGYVHATLAPDPTLAWETVWESLVPHTASPQGVLFEVSAAHYSGYRVEAPAKRNLFSDNAPVLVSWVGLGTPHFPNLPRETLNRWLKPGEHHELPALALDETATLSLAVNTGEKDHQKALVRVSGRPYAITDNATSPFLPLLSHLQTLLSHTRSPLRQANLSALLSGVDQAQAALGVQSPASAAVGAPTAWPGPDTGAEPPRQPPPPQGVSDPVLLNRLRYILSLLQGTPAERKRAEAELKRFIEELEQGDAGGSEG